MPYDEGQMGNNSPMGEGSMPEEKESQSESMHEGSDESTMFIEPDMLPKGMDVNPGDVLEFKVVGKNSDGKVQISYNHDEESKDDGSKWADGLKDEMKGVGFN